MPLSNSPDHFLAPLSAQEPEFPWITIYAICPECQLRAQLRFGDFGSEEVIPEVAALFCRHIRPDDCPSLRDAFLRTRASMT
jgi:hypothetical protein